VTSKDLEKIQKDIPDRVLETIYQEDSDLSKLIEESINTERKIIKIEKSNKFLVFQKLKFIKKLKSALRKKDNKETQKEVKNIASYYIKEIHPHFNQKLFNILGRLSPILLNFMLHSLSLIQFFKNFRGNKELNNRIIMQGNLELIKSLDKQGSLVFVPTHVSNLDSFLLGNTLHKLGLNPPLWGAGLNLFQGITISYIMNNIGCYKVDRRKKNKIYLKTLQEYSTYVIEQGQNTLFYPGGTRSRSGEIEEKLKLGLLGTVVTAFINNILNGSTKSKAYIVPIALSYTVVPEAEELALEYYFGAIKKDKILQKIAKKTTVFGRTIKVIWNNLMRDNPIYMTFGDPIDPFGNKVNFEGISIDGNGIPINILNIFEQENDFKKIRKHYTQILGEKISNDFKKLNVVLPTQVFLYSIVKYLRDKNPNLGEKEIILIDPYKNMISKNELKVEIMKTIQKIKEKAPEINLDAVIEKEDIETILKHGIDIYKSNYASCVIEVKRDNIVPKKLATIFYYSSRIRTYLS
jgi:glycerol-3-phosphate O-acyltransferase